VTLIPVLDANARIAALRSGLVDLIETVPPAAMASLKTAGFSVKINIHPTISIWKLNCLPESPFHDLRVRKAVNLAVDRESLVRLLDGAAAAAKGMVTEDSPWFGVPKFKLHYAPDEAKKLLTEAGYGPNNRLKTKILISSSGGGTPESLKTNEFVQANLAAVGIDVEFQVVDYVTLFTIYRNGAKAPGSAGIHGVYLPAPVQDPTASIYRGHASDLTAPRGTNWGFYSNPEVDEALRQAQRTFEPAAFDQAIAKVHQLLVDDAASLFLVHELDPWALSSKVKNFVQPKSWFANLTRVSVVS
jgi:ABC-type transport system substrate-binding protein